MLSKYLRISVKWSAVSVLIVYVQFNFPVFLLFSLSLFGIFTWTVICIMCVPFAIFALHLNLSVIFELIYHSDIAVVVILFLGMAFFHSSFYHCVNKKKRNKINLTSMLKIVMQICIQWVSLDEIEKEKIKTAFA